MRLLETRTGEFLSVNNLDEVRYAILSHAWAAEGEQTYHDLLAIQSNVHAARASGVQLPPNEILLRATPKIREACAYALSEGFESLWIDSCCIDKTSSAELSEAINSMYQWYGQAIICYAFLDDVTSEEDPSPPFSQFRDSRWFTRGWTLQELIAPRIVIFISAEWDMLGSKDGLSAVVEEVTGIDQAVLVHLLPLHSVSVARRMSWAAKRFTTRKEDEAYSLMGIFGVNMPTIYGEGRLAFIRLQEEILRLVPDQSLFAWERTRDSWNPVFAEESASDPTLFATSPADFELSSRFDCITVKEAGELLGIPAYPPPTYTITPYGLRTDLPLTALSPTVSIAYLACKNEDDIVVGLILQKDKGAHAWSVGAALRDLGECMYNPNFSKSPETWIRLLHLPSSAPDFLASRARIEEVYIIHRPALTPTPRLRGPSLPRLSPVQLYGNAYKIKLPKWCQSRLTEQGYGVSLSSSHTALTTPHRSPPTYIVRLLRGTVTVDINLGPCACNRGGFTSCWWLASRVSSPSHKEVAARQVSSSRHLLERAASTCKDPRAHVESWGPIEGGGWGRRTRVVLGSRTRGEALAVDLVLTCDYQGDGHYPALFSLWIDVAAVQL
ncbi:Vegetative incompatibility protein HET-E-1 [Trametes pubescens]|uniref:Vegetative incompatibility protein HET-E-1 n=1 Tax=Trametes pubescens TaxID=154538 RepID=A0A1M2V6Q9_TRAPU|nr:Vegetative incompatibility protein HET-E-1 [Trametes pubescens]